MHKIFTENINWGQFEGQRRSDFECVINDAYIEKESGVMTVVIGLNFVVPADDDRKLEKAIASELTGLSDVRIRYVYDTDHMALDEGEIVRLMIPRMIRDSGSALGNAVTPDPLTQEGEQVVVRSFGKMVTERLNEDLSMELSSSLQEMFGIRRQIRFENDEDQYAKAAAKLKAEPEDFEPAPHDVVSDMDEPDLPGALFDEDAFFVPDEAMAAVYNLDAAVPVPGLDRHPEDEDSGHTAEKPAVRRNRTPAKADNPPSYIQKAGHFQQIMGKKISRITIPLSKITRDSGEVTVEGTLYHIETRPLKNKKSRLVTMLITDKRKSLCLKFFAGNEKWAALEPKLKEGDYIVAQGTAEWDTYIRDLSVKVRAIAVGTPPKRVDTYERGKRVELHCHTQMSAMDGMNDPKRVVRQALEWGQPAVAITDHGVVQSFPDAADAAEGKEIKVIYGLEGYLYDDEGCIDRNGKIDYKKKNTSHIILLSRTQEGLKNIYKLVSLSHIDYFYKRPRIPRSVLVQHREGLILGSACEAGEVYRALTAGASDESLEKIAAFYDYLEIQPVVNNKFMLRRGIVQDLEEIRNFNRRIVALGDRLGKPVVATTDAHYDEPASAIYRNILMKGMGFKDAEEGEGLYLRTTDEMMEEFSYLGEETAFRVVVENTNMIADMIEDGIKPVPDEKFPPKIDGAEEELRARCMKNAHEKYGDPLPPEIEERLETELRSIIGNGYAVMYVSAERLVKKSLEDGYLVGSRGSVGSSFAATMAGITEVNPLAPHYICPECRHFEWGDSEVYDNGLDMPPKVCPECGAPMERNGFSIPFATFLGFKGNKEPDIDLNFASEYQSRAHRYVGEIFGEENVFKAGTVGTIADKTAYGYVRNFCDETGLRAGEFEMNRLKAGCTGVKRTTGQHPGGIIIVPRDHEIYEFCPIQHPANDTKSDIITTHFDYHKIDKNLLKLDILGHNVPSMIRQLQDMTGVDPLTVDLTDQTVLSIFNGTEALKIKDPDYRFRHGSFAIPEFGTGFVRQMLDDVNPKRFEDLIRMSGFSHGTDVWLNNAQEFIRSGQATMREAISTRDDIMNYLIQKGVPKSDAFDIMEKVRKGKGVTDERVQLMQEHDVPEWYIESCRRIKYMFPRAHAVAYVMMSFRMAWYKVYYPLEFYATHFTSVIEDFNADVILKGPDAILDRIDSISAKGPDEVTQKEKDERTVLEVACEMYARGFRFLPAELGASYALKFWTKDGRVLLPYAAYNGVGAAAARAIESAWAEKPFDTVEDCATRSGIGNSVIEILRGQGLFEGLPETAQFSWAL